MLDFSVALHPNLSAALDGLKPGAMLRAISKGMQRGTLVIAGKIQKERLTGKGPFAVSARKLGVVSGRLRGSLRTSGPTITGETVTTSIGTNVEYAAAHEFGFAGGVKVRAHEVTMTTLFGRKLKTPLRFSRLPFTRQVKIPERRPIRQGIEDHIGVINNEIARELTAPSGSTKN